MKYIVVDLEMNSLANKYQEERALCGREVIEIGAVALDEQYQEIDSFKTFVKPQYNDEIKPYFERLTGISTEMVASAPVFEDAVREFCLWCQSIDDDLQIYQWSDSDMKQILSEMNLKKIVFEKKNQSLLSDWFDFQKEFGEKLNLTRAVSLKNAVMYAGIEFSGAEHDALDDARNTAVLLKIVRTPALCKNALEHVIDALTFTPLSSTLGSMFNFAELGFSA